MRILGWFVLLVAGAIIAGLLLQRQAFIGNVERELDDTMRQELDELEALAGGGIDPATGQPFASVERLFDLAIVRNVPLDGEAVVTFVDGQPYEATAGGELLYGNATFVDEVATATASLEGSVGTEEGEVLYIARPVHAGVSGRTNGVFVAAVFASSEREEVDGAIQASALVALAVLVLASMAAWVVTGRVLRPVREVTEAARSISETDLRRRIRVAGDDEVAELASTFNAMLDRLDSAFTAQRAFVDDAGHELRTPITIVRGHLELMGDGAEEQAETVALVTDELDRMSRIVEDLLILAKSEQPDFVRTAPLELNDLTTELLMKARALGDRTWTLDTCASGVVEGDRQRLAQAVLNLARNAVEHTTDGDEIALGSARSNGEYRLWVRDTGPGIHPAEGERIFERFARGGPGGRRSDGAGLGLAITRAVAHGHGGRVQLDSEPGAGATFTLVLPAGEHADDGEGAQWPAS